MLPLKTRSNHFANQRWCRGSRRIPPMREMQATSVLACRELKRVRCALLLSASSCRLWQQEPGRQPRPCHDGNDRHQQGAPSPQPPRSLPL